MEWGGRTQDTLPFRLHLGGVIQLSHKALLPRQLLCQGNQIETKQFFFRITGGD